MTRPGDRTFWNSDEAAVAPTFVIASFALVAVMGISFDYARLAVLDSELQAAADQAALAAATQLDGLSGAIDRSTFAASNLVQNKTIFANDKNADARNLTVSSVAYYDGYTSTTDTLGNLLDTSTSTAKATADTKATVVVVTLNTRKAFYAFTPIIRLFSSGALKAQAVAGLQTSVCYMPPVMMCNPNETATTTPPYPATDGSDRGRGMLLTQAGTTWGPGNYGYLNVSGNGKPSVEQGLAVNANAAPCTSLGSVTTQPGQLTGATVGINTRFDIYDYSCSGTTCSPSMNTRKDVINGATPLSGNKCTMTNNGWILPSSPYVGVSGTSSTISNMGFPRDKCHSTGTTPVAPCASNGIGNKDWDIDTYFSVNHASDGMTEAMVQNWAGRSCIYPSVCSNFISRYDVYQFELAKGYTATRTSVESNKNAYSTPQCGTGLPSSSTVKDRRVLPVAVVNCIHNGLNGNKPIQNISGWVDLFLVEPSLNRTYTTGSGKNKVTTKYTDPDDIYVEIIAAATTPAGNNAFQYYQRREVRLLK